jgi:hypothetical protein
MTKRQPNVDDLRWEVIRRHPDYRKDYEQFKQNPDAEGVSLGKWRCEAWELLWMEDPAVPWDESIHPDYNKPTCPVVGIHSACVKLRWGPPMEGYLPFFVDPRCSKRKILKKIEEMLDHWKGSHVIPKATDTVKKHLKELRLVDEMEAENSGPIIQWTFKNSFGSKYRSKMRTYARGKILIQDPFADVTREITPQEAQAYLYRHNLEESRK